MSPDQSGGSSRFGLGRLFGKATAGRDSDDEKTRTGPSKWSMGVLNDRETVEVPGSVLLLASHRNEPLGLRNVHARTSHSSIPAGFPVDIPLTPGGSRPMPATPPSAPAADQHDQSADKKTTENGDIILEPQPDDSANDPLNWPGWRRDLALLTLGFYCMIGGGITPIIAAGFTNVGETFHIEVERVSLTTGLYMLGLGVGSVIASPTAILYGKRPVYLVSAIIFIGTSLWAAWSPTFNSLLVARVFQGMAVSPVECLPSATVAEIFFLHERAFRIGIYTLLLLSGKNLVPLVSAAIIGRFGWRWVFWIVAMVVALGFVLLFLFVPETFWDRTPTRKPSKRPSFLRRLSSRHVTGGVPTPSHVPFTAPGRLLSPGAVHRSSFHVGFAGDGMEDQPVSRTVTNRAEDDHILQVPGSTHSHHRNHHVGFAETSSLGEQVDGQQIQPSTSQNSGLSMTSPHVHHGVHASSATLTDQGIAGRSVHTTHPSDNPLAMEKTESSTSRNLSATSPRSNVPPTPDLHNFNSPFYYNSNNSVPGSEANVDYFTRGPNLDNEKIPASDLRAPPKVQAYTHNLRQQPPKSFVQQLKPWHGRLNNDKWLKVMIRPFILFAYPSVLWSAAVYACSIGWLIVISETMAIIYRDPTVYNFTALQTGLVYISPFIGGILGTGVAGKISDIVVKAMTRRNGGLYEPEFRLVMVIPMLVTTCIGLMGFGWSADERDQWIVPTLFFGIVSFGCSLGSTTSITFCVDSYRQYAGEALVTLNFAKNIFHGMVFSLFVTNWLASDGPKTVFIWIGVIQLIVLLTTIPMYLFGKRARMWTVRKNLMEKF